MGGGARSLAASSVLSPRSSRTSPPHLLKEAGSCIPTYSHVSDSRGIHGARLTEGGPSGAGMAKCRSNVTRRAGLAGRNAHEALAQILLRRETRDPQRPRSHRHRSVTWSQSFPPCGKRRRTDTRLAVLTLWLRATGSPRQVPVSGEGESQLCGMEGPPALWE